MRVAFVGNKVTGPGDEAFLREHVGDGLLACLTASPYVRAAEQGRFAPLDALEPQNRAALDALRATVDARDKDWGRFQRQAVDFHRRNAHAWASKAAGTDLTEQIDPDFEHGPRALNLLPA
jgi:CO dehydrogenase maturation factor